MSTHRHADTRGFALITSLLLTVIVTLFALSMFKSTGLQARIAGNVREKERALHAALVAQNYAEWWLAQGHATTGVNCSGSADANAGQSRVCANALASSIDAPWLNGTTYLPPDAGSPGDATVAFAVSRNGGAGTYYDVPQFYIQYVGLAAGGQGRLYRIDALGWGGNASAVAVVESTYVVGGSRVRDLGAL